MLVIGIGNAFRSDDAVGLFVARRLRSLENEHLIILEHSGEATTLMESWEGHDFVILVDALSSGRVPGAFLRINAVEDAIPAQFFSASTHNMGMAEAIELARTLGKLPEKLFVYGIEGKNYQPGETLSPEVERTINEVTEDIASLASRSDAL